MENNERELILQELTKNAELRRLYREHEDLERRVSRFDSRNFLTSREEMELKRLKKQKLHGVDRMMRLLSETQAQVA